MSTPRDLKAAALAQVRPSAMTTKPAPVFVVTGPSALRPQSTYTDSALTLRRPQPDLVINAGAGSALTRPQTAEGSVFAPVAPAPIFQTRPAPTFGPMVPSAASLLAAATPSALPSMTDAVKKYSRQPRGAYKELIKEAEANAAAARAAGPATSYVLPQVIVNQPSAPATETVVQHEDDEDGPAYSLPDVTVKQNPSPWWLVALALGGYAIYKWSGK